MRLDHYLTVDVHGECANLLHVTKSPVCVLGLGLIGGSVLRAAAMNRRLHLLLDQLLGTGRVLFQEMALVKPPRIGSEKPWHQDASYFRVTEPDLIVGVWIALDPALRRNGCMEVIPGSHLGGGVPHELLTVHDGGHEFDTVGEIPSESQVVGAVVDFFVRTLMEHKGAAQGA